MASPKLPSDRVLTLRQPFAQFVLTTGKSATVPLKWCENRTWKAEKLHPSKLDEDEGCPRILIHAATQLDHEAIADLGMPSPGFRSAIVGSVRLLGIVDVQALLKTALQDARGFDHEAVAAEYFQQLRKKVSGKSVKPDFLMEGMQFVTIPEYDGPWYWWLIDRPMSLQKPIGCKGKLGLWKYKV